MCKMKKNSKFNLCLYKLFVQNDSFSQLCLPTLSHHKAPESKWMVARNMGENRVSILECTCAPTLPLVQSPVQRFLVSASAEIYPAPAKGWSVRCLGRATTGELKKAHKGQCPQIYVIAYMSVDSTKANILPKIWPDKSHTAPPL